MKNKPLLIVAFSLIVLGLYRSDLISMPLMPNSHVACAQVEVDAPVSEDLKSMAETVAQCLQDGSSDRSIDGNKLARLYHDMSILIELDSDSVINSTAAIRQANVLAAKLLQIDLKGKYPGLSEACDNLVKENVSENSVPLNPTLRSKAVNAFRALAWGCLKGAK